MGKNHREDGGVHQPDFVGPGNFQVYHSHTPGGTQIWFWQGCVARPSQPLPIIAAHFGRKGYPVPIVKDLKKKEAHFSQILP